MPGRVSSRCRLRGPNCIGRRSDRPLDRGLGRVTRLASTLSSRLDRRESQKRSGQKTHIPRRSGPPGTRKPGAHRLLHNSSAPRSSACFRLAVWFCVFASFGTFPPPARCTDSQPLPLERPVRGARMFGSLFSICPMFSLQHLVAPSLAGPRSSSSRSGETRWGPAREEMRNRSACQT